MLLSDRTVQTFLKDQHLYEGAVDGVFGKKSWEAVAKMLAQANAPFLKWKSDRRRIAVEQIILDSYGHDIGEIDGLIGPKTRYASEEYNRLMREEGNEPTDDEVAHQPTVWPRQKDVPGFYGQMGSHLVSVPLPYKMRLTWNPKALVTKIRMHEKVADSAERVFKKIHKIYGSRIPELRLDMYSGCVADPPRTMRGGSKPSMHNWGIAIDFDDVNNQLHWGKDRATLARPEYNAFWDAWYEEGWIGLGRECNYDWMHVQAARL